MRYRLDQVVIDAVDPQRLVRFYAALLGGDPVDRARGWSHVQPPGFPKLSFQPVPEPVTGKNRLHLDVEVDDDDDALQVATARAEELGGQRVGAPVRDDAGAYQVVRDPEGNVFCFVCD
ncbi:VOC family protein [Quadrisphaera setariae]|uniref:VOC family protein n=1 Tax=Quadrisphaera setariae TaxID=2593304 RepID=A0A5C8ZHT7_9ACTN|nr:VOC family protein [Quadrisphaera setariae]TXR57452.1 VOC family protein [Quadrisphaera setariae]